MSTRTTPILISSLVVLLAASSGGSRPTSAQTEPTCRPTLALADVQFSDMQPPTLERKWSAVVSVNAEGCRLDAHGEFEIVFTRLKEIGRAIEFRERYVWRAPAVKVEVDFWADEAVEVNGYWIDNVSTCPCVQPGEKSTPPTN
ncbi:MAG: hypothetical protein QOD74_594 [Variibacter sp.]|nr:hypothetical protein [Variibacter sp.]